jgi:hypothetical protein
MKRVAVAALFAASASSLAVNLETVVGWAFAAAALLSVFWRTGRLSPRLAGLGKRLIQLALVLMGLLGWVLVTYPILSAPTLRLWSLVLGFTFGALGSLFLLTDGLTPREGAIPAGIGLLVVSAFDLEARILPYLIAAAGAGFLYLVSEVVTVRTHRRWARAMVLAGFALPFAATASGIVLMLPWTQGKIEETVLIAYAPKGDGGEGHRRLGDLRSLKLSKRVVMRVYSERPQKLRSGVLVRFDGLGWHRDPTTVRTLAPTTAVSLGDSERTFLSSIPGSDFVPESGDLTGQRLIRTAVVRVDGSGLATPGGSRLVHAPIESIQIDRAGVVQAPPRTAVRWYGILHELDHRLAQGGPLEAAELESSLQLPEGLDPRIHEMGAELVEGESSPERAVENVISHLRSQYRYSLDVGELDRRDPLSDFLFRKREGWCEYFATAAAILLRTQGVPTRYVTGFNVIGSQRKGDYYLVRDWDRHAWIEAYVEGKGWVEYDPTPAAEYESLHAGESGGFWTEGVEWLRARLASLYVRLRYLDGSRLSVLAASALGLVLVARFLRRRRRAEKKLRPQEAPKPVATGLEDLVAKLDRRAAELGYPRRQATAPLEHWQSIPEGRFPGRQREVGLQILESFYRARFGGDPVSSDEAEGLGRALESAC